MPTQAPEVLLTYNPPPKASLFVTCIIDQIYPQVGVSAVRVLRKLGVEVDFPFDQTCCGQPLYNSGFTQQARKLVQRVLTSFKDSQYIVVPSGSCAAMIKVFYLDLLADDPILLRQAQEMASKTYEFSEFLVKVLKVENMDVTYSGKSTYHPSCHLLREMGVVDEPRALLEQVANLEMKDLPGAESCCGFGGTFAVKFPHISESMMFEKVRNIVSSGADTVVSCDMGCLMNISGGLSRQGVDIQVKHLAQVLDQEAE